MTLPAVPERVEAPPLVDARCVAELKPEYRRIAEYRSVGKKTGQIAKLTGYSRVQVARISKRPDVKAAVAFYSQQLHQKLLASQQLAADLLPRMVQKVADMADRPEAELRDVVKGGHLVAQVAGGISKQSGDRVGQKIVINLSPAQAQQVQVSALEDADDVEWEEVVVEEEGEGEDEDDGE